MSRDPSLHLRPVLLEEEETLDVSETRVLLIPEANPEVIGDKQGC